MFIFFIILEDMIKFNVLTCAHIHIHTYASTLGNKKNVNYYFILKVNNKCDKPKSKL